MTQLSIRPIIEEDASCIVRYWFDNTDENLSIMGADKSRFNSREDFSNNLVNICRTPPDQAKTYYLIWLVDNKPIGHSTLRDILKGEMGHMHLHMWYPEYRGKGRGGKLFCLSALEFYRLFNLRMILCEPRSSNPMPNKMLTKVGFKKWKTYLSTSSEISLTCELNSYIIDPQIADTYLKSI